MVSTKWILFLFVIILLTIQQVFAISNIQHSVDGNKVTLTYQGTPPFWINIRGDTNIGQAGGYLWAKTYSNSFSYDMSFAINPSKKFYYGVKDSIWSNTNSFVLGSTNLCDINNEFDNNWILLGPSDGKVLSLEYMNNKEIYVATSSGGVFRSLDKGDTWNHFSEGLESSKTFLLKTIGNKLYVTAGSGVYVLESNKWKNILKVDGAIFYSIDYDGLNGRLWSLADNGVYYSDDSGISWNSAKVAGNSEGYIFLFISKKNEVYVSTFNNLYKNSGTPDKWVKILDKGVFATEAGSTHPFTEDDEGNLYIVAMDYNTYLKKSNQNVFEKSSIKAEKGTLLYFNKMFFYEEGWGKFIISDEKNNILKIISSEGVGQFGNGFWDIRQMYPIINENRILIAHDNGVSELDLTTKNVKKLSPIPKYSEITSLAIIGKSNSLLTTYWDHSSLVTNNCGLTWKQGSDWEGDYLFGDPTKNIYLKKDQNTIYLRDSDFAPLWGIDCLSTPFIASITLDSTSNPTKAYTLCKENNEGRLVSFNIVNDFFKNNLLKTNLPTPYLQGIIVDPTNLARLIVVGNSEVYESLNKGQNWNKIINRPEGGLWVSIAINPFNSAEVLIGGFDGNIFLVKNGQIKEISVSTSSSHARGFIYSLAYDDKNPSIIYIGASNGFYYSKDNGQTWQEFNNGLYSKDIRKIISKDDRIFIGTWGSGIAVILKKNLGLN